jgi:hypothetical protein
MSQENVEVVRPWIDSFNRASSTPKRESAR